MFRIEISSKHKQEAMFSSSRRSGDLFCDCLGPVRWVPERRNNILVQNHSVRGGVLGICVDFFRPQSNPRNAGTTFWSKTIVYGGGFRNLPRFFSPAAPKMRFPWTIPLLACSESKSHMKTLENKACFGHFAKNVRYL